MLCSRLLSAVDLSCRRLPGLAKQAEVTIDASRIVVDEIKLVGSRCGPFSGFGIVGGREDFGVADDSGEI